MPRLGPKVVWKCDVCGREADAHEGGIPRGPGSGAFRDNWHWFKINDVVLCANCWFASRYGIRLVTGNVVAHVNIAGMPRSEAIDTTKAFAKLCPVDDSRVSNPDLSSFEGIHGDWVVRRRTEDDKSVEESSG